MPRTTRVPYHQNVYDLFDVVRCEHIPEAAAQITEWERRTGRVFPASMTEFYTTAVTVRTGGDAPRDWRLSCPELWSEYSNDERARAVPEVFETFTPRPWVRIPALPTPGFELIWENQGNWVMCARGDEPDDPVVEVSDPCFLSPPEMWEREASGWSALGQFSELLMAWFTVYYQEEFSPMSYQHRSYETGLPPELAPPKPYANGLWLRSPLEPVEPAAFDFLTDHFGEPERTPRPRDVTTSTFRKHGVTIRVTADEPPLGGGMSAWWVHADTPEHLAEIARALVPFGTLRETLRADTEPARAVLDSVRG